MRRGKAVAGIGLVLAAVFAAGCGDLSCWVDLTESTTLPGSMDEPDDPTGGAPSISTPPTIQDTNTGTAVASTTSTTKIPTTTTTLSALEVYRSEMRAWKNSYAADMQEGYDVLRAMRNPLDPSDEEITAARTMADLMDGLVADLEDITAPAGLSAAHAAYLGSLKDMHEGVDRLADALEAGGVMGAVNVTRAFATIYAADSDGKGPRATLEQALGFSLTSADRSRKP